MGVLFYRKQIILNMMKKKLIYLCTFVFTISLLSSCNEDEATKDDLLGTWNIRSSGSMEIIWESSENISITEEISLPTSTVAELLVEYGNNQLSEELKSITFRKDDKVEFTYFDDDLNGWNTDVFGEYKVKSRKDLIFRPDVDKLLEGMDVSATSLAGIKALVATTGIPLKITFIGPTAAEVRLSIETGTMKEMKVLFPILAASITGNSAEDIMIKILLEKLPELIEKSDKIEVGFYFDKALN